MPRHVEPTHSFCDGALLPLLLLIATAGALEPPDCRSSNSSGFVTTPTHPLLPQLPLGTVTLSRGVTSSACRFDGTIVVAGPQSLDGNDRYIGYSVTMRRSATIFLDWFNGVRGGVQIGSSRYAMRLVWVGDASSKTQVSNSTIYAARRYDADFLMAGYGVSWS